VRGRPLAGSWLVGVALGSITLAVLRGDVPSAAFPMLLGAAGFLLLTHAGRDSRRFPDTELERGLDRLFALLLPARKPATTLGIAITQQRHLARLRNGARRWANELQLITTDGYQTTSRIASRCLPTGERDEQALAEEAVKALTAERANAGADPTLAHEPVSMLAYGLGARPSGADLTSLEDLLSDLGLGGERDELRTQFDDIVAVQSVGLELRNDSQRSMFRELAGASYVLGASKRILELASFTPAGDTATRAATVSPA
jgi:hypothetical protein